METALPRGPSPVAAIAQPQARIPSQATQTDLPRQATVQAAEQSSQSRAVVRDSVRESGQQIARSEQPSRQDQSASAADEPRTQSRLELDPETESVIFRSVDADSGEVLKQFPSDSLLKLRAYAREVVSSQLNSEKQTSSKEA
jgi:flagellar protein FlaG